MKRKEPVLSGKKFEANVFIDLIFLFNPDISLSFTMEEEEQVTSRKRKAKRRTESWELSYRTKPDAAADREKNRRYRFLATKGVVTLFNAIRERQQKTSKMLEEAKTTRSKEKVIHELKKDEFFESLQNSDIVNPVKGSGKQKDKAEMTSKWEVLRDDFLIGIKRNDQSAFYRRTDGRKKISHVIIHNQAVFLINGDERLATAGA
ncbi:RRP15-like protein [Trichinella patagoniensis]|uniref:RRP15-like protein n=1 Tax=Trichinella patagoniensis TaxID=990121 RepID=A0A0V1ADV1_9BILA|nr:RRP15-like protein [Trichinella patagoniensis]